MKKLAVILLICSTSVHADDWVLPLIGGVALGSIIGNVNSNPRPYYIQQYAPQYIAPASVYYSPSYGGAPYGYHYETLYDPNLGAYRTVLIRNF
jgi:hypothetical protein